ncbi:hypothetical protein LCGC14_2571490, partial [marine sediment metagenome]
LFTMRLPVWGAEIGLYPAATADCVALPWVGEWGSA